MELINISLRWLKTVGTQKCRIHDYDKKIQNFVKKFYCTYLY